MSIRTNLEVRVTPSILDRLLDYDPQSSQEAPKSNAASLADLRQSVRRDLEWLLNTRHSIVEIAEGMEELKDSLAVYGLPDITGMGVDIQGEQKKLVKAVENAIRVFEPRFLEPRVTLLPISSVERELRLRIEAKLDVDPVPEAISFDTVLQMGSGEFQVKNS
ncbi:MAG: type VI secretion system baseplate subunit TssE [Acidobacteria bacterium]|nr:type VI secretion system baseplate subunit TssE [Acidobacteriota bacterium]